jgi:protein-serine/threonine kinase
VYKIPLFDQSLLKKFLKCPGGDLFTCIMTERMSEIEKLCCFKQMLQGLAYLHSVGVAHRDLKPENLLLTMDGKLKITDFGVSDVFRFPWESKGRPSHGLVGSEPYIAPEAFEKGDYWGHISDVWSAGIVFYCICLGGLAWHIAKKSDPSYASYLGSLEQSKLYELFRPLGSNERRVLYRMLDPNPSNRITSSELLKDDWVKSIAVCEDSIDSSSRVHKHTEGIQPVCSLLFILYVVHIICLSYSIPSLLFLLFTIVILQPFLVQNPNR